MRTPDRRALVALLLVAATLTAAVPATAVRASAAPWDDNPEPPAPTEPQPPVRGEEEERYPVTWRDDVTPPRVVHLVATQMKLGAWSRRDSGQAWEFEGDQRITGHFEVTVTDEELFSRGLSRVWLAGLSKSTVEMYLARADTYRLDVVLSQSEDWGKRYRVQVGAVDRAGNQAFSRVYTLKVEGDVSTGNGNGDDLDVPPKATGGLKQPDWADGMVLDTRTTSGGLWALSVWAAGTVPYGATNQVCDDQLTHLELWTKAGGANIFAANRNFWAMRYVHLWEPDGAYYGTKYAWDNSGHSFSYDVGGDFGGRFASDVRGWAVRDDKSPWAGSMPEGESPDNGLAG